MSVQTYVSLESERSFAPLIEMAVDLVARDMRWRRSLIEQVAPSRRDVIAELGCGDGALTVLLAQSAKGADIYGFDQDPLKLARARVRARAAGVRAVFGDAQRDDVAILGAHTLATKIVVNLTGADIDERLKRAMLSAARALLTADGALHVAAFAPRRVALVRNWFGSVPQTAPAAPTTGGVLGSLIRAADFEAVEETARIPTASGVICLYRARAF